MNSNIDFVIVGAGFYGVTIARLLTDAGFKCIIIDKRDHIGGNCYTAPGDKHLYDIHVYGPHVFHTSDYEVAQFITNYTKFNSYQHNTLALSKSKLYSLPFNMHTFYELFNVITPEDAYKQIEIECKDAENIYKNRNDLEAIANKLVGMTIYNTLIKDYTEKQWNKKCSELSGDIIKRLPLRFNYNNNYFNDMFWGVPTEGYTKIFENIINGNGYDNVQRAPILYMLNVDYLENKKYFNELCNNIIYCGAIDELLDYKLGELEWRSLRFEHHQYTYNGYNGQGTAVINYIDSDIKETRSIDHMYFTPERWKDQTQFDSVITKEFPDNYEKGKERYYPINNEVNNKLYNDYIELLKTEMPNIIPGGRLGKYKYFDMDDVIKEAINDSKTIMEYIKNMNGK